MNFASSHYILRVILIFQGRGKILRESVGENDNNLKTKRKEICTFIITDKTSVFSDTNKLSLPLLKKFLK